MYSVKALMLLTATACVLGRVHGASGGDALRYDSLDAERLIALMESDTPLVLIDSRSPQRYRAGHIPGAINIPHHLTRTAEAMPDSMDAIIVFYCDGPG
jgi:3-mercaptopyruvate sulfurtransferase SseA